MGLLSYDPMEDGESASANLWNVRLSAIHDLLNGNIDAANLANGAVTTPKIADGAVTSDKLDIGYGIDDNGWQVFNFGTNKRYIYTQSHAASGTYSDENIPFPVGVTTAQVKEASLTHFIVSDIYGGTGGAGDWAQSFWDMTLRTDNKIGVWFRMSAGAGVGAKYPAHKYQITIVA